MSDPLALVRAMVIEDEVHARKNLREYAHGLDWLRFVAEAADGLQAVEIVDSLKPDLIFLDVNLPELSGLEVLERVRHTPEVVFTTAYDRYALAAFEAGALDYLLKPFGRDRFLKTMQRVRERFSGRTTTPSQTETPRDRLKAVVGVPLRRLFARTADGIVPIDAQTIHHVEAGGDYVEVHCDGGTYLLNMTLSELEARLDPASFHRIHRSHLVNFDAVQRMTAYDDRRLLVCLRDGTEIVASRSASELLRGMAR